jgi:cysteine desulfuration protein SufE
MQTIKERESDLLEDFSMFADWNDKYNYIMDMGEELPRISEENKNQQTLVEGCQSASWLEVNNKNGKLYYRGDSESILGKGVIAMLLNIINGHEPKEIYEYDFNIVEAIDLPNHLSPTRKIGLESVINRIKELAKQNL